MFQKIFRALKFAHISHEPLIKIVIHSEAILHNLAEYRSRYPKLDFAPVLKSNAYGHGLIETAKVLEPTTPAFLVIDSFFEAMRLRKAGIKAKLVVMGFSRVEELLKGQLRETSFAIGDLSTLKIVSQRLDRRQSFHLKLDTGMHRLGIGPSEADEAIALIKQNPYIILEGICSHFADSKSTDRTFTEAQIKTWNELVAKFRAALPSTKYFHVAASSGVAYSGTIDANAARLGAGLYGFNQSPFEHLDLQPALEAVSIIGSIKNIPAGEKIGYDLTYQTQRPTTIAIVPMGYNEGVDVRLSNIGSYLVKGQPCKIIGKISMNMSMIDVTSVSGVKVGEEVKVISKNTTDANSIESMAQLAQTNPRELLIHIPSYLRRIVV